MKWIITASERQKVVAVTAFKRVLMAVFLCGFFIFLFFFQFSTEPDIFPLELNSSHCSEELLFPLSAFRRSARLIALRQGGLFERHTPFGVKWRCFHKFYCDNKPAVIVRNYFIHKRRTAQWISEQKRHSDWPWHKSEMFNQQNCKDVPTSNFMWAVHQMTMWIKKKKIILWVINAESRMILVCDADHRQLHNLKRSRSHLYFKWSRTIEKMIVQCFKQTSGSSLPSTFDSNQWMSCGNHLKCNKEKSRIESLFDHECLRWRFPNGHN